MVPPSLPPLSSAYGSSYSDRMLSSLSTSPLLTLSAYAPWFIGKYSITNALGFSDASPQPPSPPPLGSPPLGSLPPFSTPPLPPGPSGLITPWMPTPPSPMPTIPTILLPPPLPSPLQGDWLQLE